MLNEVGPRANTEEKTHTHTHTTTRVRKWTEKIGRPELLAVIMTTVILVKIEKLEKQKIRN